jgi:hypothetical protein
MMREILLLNKVLFTDERLVAILPAVSEFNRVRKKEYLVMPLISCFYSYLPFLYIDASYKSYIR